MTDQRAEQRLAEIRDFANGVTHRLDTGGSSINVYKLLLAQVDEAKDALVQEHSQLTYVTKCYADFCVEMVPVQARNRRLVEFIKKVSEIDREAIRKLGCPFESVVQELVDRAAQELEGV